MRKLSKHRPVPTTVNLDALHLQGEDEVADYELATTDAPVVESPTPAMRDPVSQVATPQGSATCLHSGGVGRPTNEALDQASFCADSLLSNSGADDPERAARTVRALFAHGFLRGSSRLFSDVRRWAWG